MKASPRTEPAKILEGYSTIRSANGAPSHLLGVIQGPDVKTDSSRLESACSTAQFSFYRSSAR